MKWEFNSAANKSDLRRIPGLDCIQKREIEELASEFKLKWFETSAKSGKMVYQTFEFLSSEILENHEQEVQSEQTINLKTTENVKQKKCC